MKNDKEENDTGLKEKRRTVDNRSHSGQSPSSVFEAWTHRNFDFS
jgi:hypothetical protein